MATIPKPTLQTANKPLERILFGLLASLVSTTLCHACNWDEISPDDLAATECELDPSAPAEVLYKEIIYDLSENNVRIIKYHIRTKIYERNALDQVRRTKFWYYSYYKASGIHARVIKPDGSDIEVEDEDIVTQTKSRKKLLPPGEPCRAESETR